MKMIPDWRKAWRMFSVQALAVLFVWLGMPADMQAEILAALCVESETVPRVLVLVSLVGRLVQQRSVSGDSP